MNKLRGVRANHVFCVIWLVTSLVFAYQAIDSHKSINTELYRFRVNFPINGGTVKFGPVDIPRLLTEMADSNNWNVLQLEKSIRESAKVTFWSNVISCLMATAGLVAQVTDLFLAKRSVRALVRP